MAGRQVATIAQVRLWGALVGLVAWDPVRGYAAFEYAPEFIETGIELSPIMMPLSREPFSFPSLSRETYRGLPGTMADSLPDKFGNSLIDQWLAESGRSPETFNAVERLMYVGRRGMGALEFHPVIERGDSGHIALDIEELVKLSSRVLTMKESQQFKLDASDTSANVEGLADPLGYGRIEYAYYLMARDAGIEMTRCRLMEENGRAHFMTRRFDRTEDGQKLHMQSLCALGHHDFNVPGATSYEQAFLLCRQLGLGMAAREQLFLRMAFNVLAYNRDDHTKQVAFLMDKAGQWRLSPAYDMTYAFNPAGDFTNSHQMTINRKRDGIGDDDLLAVAHRQGLNRASARRLLDTVREVTGQWQSYAVQAQVQEQQRDKIARLIAQG